MFTHVFTYQYERMTSTLELKSCRDLFSVKKKVDIESDIRSFGYLIV